MTFIYGLSGLIVFALQTLQASLPLNPQHLANVTTDSAFNTAVSFATNNGGFGRDDTRLSARSRNRHRQLLGRPDSRYVIYPVAAIVCALLSRSECVNQHPTPPDVFWPSV
jgi:hypothetical protein